MKCSSKNYSFHLSFLISVIIMSYRSTNIVFFPFFFLLKGTCSITREGKQYSEVVVGLHYPCAFGLQHCGVSL